MSIDQTFINLFKGKDTISGRSAGYNAVKVWLEKGNRQKKMFTCLVFYEKPIQFLATGQTAEKEGKTAKGDGEKVASSLTEFLPLHEESTLSDLEARTEAKYGAFKRVNFSMVRRVALLSVQKAWLVNPLVDQWIQRYGGRPSVVNYSNSVWKSMHEETHDIKKLGLDQFKEDQVYWQDVDLTPV
jgi:hypothetical protein